MLRAGAKSKTTQEKANTMFAKTAIALVVALFATALAAQAEWRLKGAEFEPLEPVAGKSGRKVEVKARLFLEYQHTKTRELLRQPLSGAWVTFEAYQQITRSGTRLFDRGPVGRKVKTDADGWAVTQYKLPSGAKEKIGGKYWAEFAGGTFDGVLLKRKPSKPGKVIVSP